MTTRAHRKYQEFSVTLLLVWCDVTFSAAACR